jgi:hypothetical protein
VGLKEAFVPLQERQFRLLWLGRVSSAVGDALVPVALAFAVLSVNRSQLALGGVPCRVDGRSRRLHARRRCRCRPPSAPRRDARVRRRSGDRRGVHRNDAPDASDDVAALLRHRGLFGAASAFFAPASDGLVPQTISTEKLRSANALLGISRNAMNVFGPAVSGVLIAVAGTGYVFAIDSVSFLASAFFLV